MALSKQDKTYLQAFLRQHTPEFGCIVTSWEDEHHAFCAVCSCDISISHRGTNFAIHKSSKKHASNFQCQEKQQCLQQFFLWTTPTTSSEQNACSRISCSSTTSR
ncbi:hypothetical protein MRX96_038479 [Rhipicephalus microplus]